MNEEGPMFGERGLEAAEKYSTAFLKRSTLSSIRDWRANEALHRGATTLS